MKYELEGWVSETFESWDSNNCTLLLMLAATGDYPGELREFQGCRIRITVEHVGEKAGFGKSGFPGLEENREGEG